MRTNFEDLIIPSDNFNKDLVPSKESSNLYLFLHVFFASMRKEEEANSKKEKRKRLKEKSNILNRHKWQKSLLLISAKVDYIFASLLFLGLSLYLFNKCMRSTHT